MSDTDTILARDVSRDQLVAELRALRPTLESHGVTHMTLFGSRARQDNRPDSDIDLAIEIEEGRKFSLIDLVRVERLVGIHVGLLANLFIRRSLDGGFIAQIARDGIEIY